MRNKTKPMLIGLLIGLSIGLGIFGIYMAPLINAPEVYPIPKEFRSDGYQRIGYTNLIHIPGEDTLEIVKSESIYYHLRILSKGELERKLDTLESKAVLNIKIPETRIK